MTTGTRLTLPVEGLTDDESAAAIQRQLRQTPGVQNAAVNPTTGKATVLLAQDGPTVAQLVDLIRESGFDCACAWAALDVEGLRYAPGVAALERALADIRGVLSVTANPATERVIVQYVSGLVTPRQLETAVERKGLTVSKGTEADDPILGERLKRAREERLLTWKLAAAAAVTAVSAIGTLPLMERAPAREVDMIGALLRSVATALEPVIPALFGVEPLRIEVALAVLTLAVLVWPGAHLFGSAWRGLRAGVVDMNTLAATGIGVVFLYSVVAIGLARLLPNAGVAPNVYFESVNAAVALVLLARLIDRWATGATREPALELAMRRPATARVRRAGLERELAIREVRVGDEVVVRPGDVVPVDGVVESGESRVDEAILSGEATPGPRGPGSRLIAGTVNGSGTLVMKADGVGADTALEQVLEALSEGPGSGPRVQSVADHLARHTVLVTIVSAVAATVAWAVLGPSPRTILAMVGFASVLLVATPAAFGVAAPMSLLVAAGRAARAGVLMPSGAVIEAVSAVDTLVFDKTGTLTRGRGTVTHVIGRKRADGSSINPAEILRLAAAVEARSDHPIAAAIVRSAKEKGVQLEPADRFVAMEGRGARGIVGKFLIEVISVRHVRERSIDLGNLAAEADRHLDTGRTPVVVVVNDTVQGLIVVADELKPDAKETVAALKRMGYRTYLLTGDARSAAESIARDVGIDGVLAQVEPEQRAEEIRRLQGEGRRVGMVGHGIRDAAALRQADVGIALGAGPEIARVRADVTVVQGRVHGVAVALGLARRTMRTIRSNLAVLLAYHLLGIPLAAGALYPVTGLVLGPVVAVAAMVGTGSVVVRRSLGLARYHLPSSTAS